MVQAVPGGFCKPYQIESSKGCSACGSFWSSPLTSFTFNEGFYEVRVLNHSCYLLIFYSQCLLGLIGPCIHILCELICARGTKSKSKPKQVFASFKWEDATQQPQTASGFQIRKKVFFSLLQVLIWRLWVAFQNSETLEFKKSRKYSYTCSVHYWASHTKVRLKLHIHVKNCISNEYKLFSHACDV